MRTVYLTCVMAILLMGCATPAQRAAQKASEAEEILQIYGPACERLGYVARSDAWRNCMVQLNQTDALRYSYGYSYPYRWRTGPYF